MLRILLSTFLLVLVQQACPQTLVMPGDYPDPSVVKIGDRYYASATSSNWAPSLPLLESRDLVHWELKGYVFNTLPTWADYYFWAPEISLENNKVYVYYTAHKKDGNLCVAIASADSVGGKFTDHGPVMCQEAGSIDAFPMRDENGKLYLIWKEDGNSINQPTPIWAASLGESRTKITGEKVKLFVNDQPWEGNLVEGVSIIQRNGFFYALYSASGCCGRSCSYGIGVARAKSLLGPWEKYERNPLLTNSGQWKCNGHGTVVEKEGRFYLLHHAYDTAGTVYVGRQGVLSAIAFTDDGWIRFTNEKSEGVVVEPELHDSFNSTTLSPEWQWSVFSSIKYAIDKGALKLNALPLKCGAYIGQKVYSNKYEASVVIDKASDAESGIALIGDDDNIVYASFDRKKIRVMKVESGRETLVAEAVASSRDKIHLKITVSNNKDVRFFWSSNGSDFKPINSAVIDASYLPPWDRGLRVGLIAKGQPTQQMIVHEFTLRNR